VTVDIEKPRALIFDWDNTLVDTWPTIHEALRQTFEAMDVEPWTLDQTRQRVRRSMRESFPELFGDRWTKARDIFYDAYERVHLTSLTPCDGASEGLSVLAESDLYLGVISNKTGRYLRSEARHLGWDRYFGRLVGAGDAARDKPAPEPVSHALEGSGIDTGRDVWMIGDAGVDMEIAHLTGLVPVLVKDGEPDPDEFAAHEPFHQVANFDELVRYIREF
jgi:phosphoglycolate phosphatase